MVPRFCRISFVLGALVLGWCAAAPGQSVAPLLADRDAILLQGIVGDPRTKNLPKVGGETRLFLIQLNDEPTAELLDDLRRDGFELLDAVPNRAYIARAVSGDGGRKALANRKSVRWFSPMAAEWRMEPGLADLEATTEVDALIVLWRGVDAAAFADGLKEDSDLDAAVDARAGTMVVRAPASALHALAARDEVRWIERAPSIQTRGAEATGEDRKAAAVAPKDIGIAQPLWQIGVRGLGQVLGHIDTYVDQTSCFLVDTENPVGPDHRKLLALRGAGEVARHGTQTATVAAGFPVFGENLLVGQAPAARISHDNLAVLMPGLDRDQPRNFIDLTTALENARADGARIHTNSWGEDNRWNYTNFASAADYFLWLNEDALILFAATNLPIVYTPENARNVLAVAGAGVAPYQSIRYGGRGFTADGRIKPEIVAPGLLVPSGVPGSCSVGEFSGASAACAMLAGSALLLRDYLTSGRHPSGTPRDEDRIDPSGALLKAMLVHSARPMTGQPDRYPSRLGGWGFAEAPAMMRSEQGRMLLWQERRDAGEGLATGDTRVYTLVQREEGPLRVTLAWMDPPSAFGVASPVINNLDLEVISPDGRRYLGNVYTGTTGSTGGSADLLNNVERIDVAAAPPGEHRIIVRAPRVEPLFGAQGFALVATGPVATTTGPPGLAFNAPTVSPASATTLIASHPLWPFPVVHARVTVGEGGDSEMYSLRRGSDGLFRASVALVDSPVPIAGNGLLEVTDGAVLSARLNEELLTTNAVVDTRPPALVSIEALKVEDTAATLRVVASEPALGEVVLRDIDGGTTWPLTQSAANPAVLEARIGNLPPAAWTRLSVVLRDGAGNHAVFDDRRQTLSLAYSRILYRPRNNGLFSIQSQGPGGWAQSGSDPLAFAVATPAQTADHRLVMGPISLPGDMPRMVLEFNQTVEMELESPAGDGGVLEIRDVGSQIWTDLGPWIEVYPYDSRAFTNNALAGRDAWINPYGGPRLPVRVDLTPWAGRTISLSWRLLTDNAVGRGGWTIEAPTIIGYTAAPPPPPVVDGWMLE